MASLREIKQKKTSVQSINKITKAMELVATSKSRKSLNRLLIYRIYYSEMMNTVSKFVNYVEQKSDQKRTYWIIIGSDLGLAGGYNSNIVKLALANVKKEDRVVVIGNKLISLKEKLNVPDYKFISNQTIIKELPIKETTLEILKYYHDENYQIKLIYTKYNSQIDFVPTIQTVLPIPKMEEKQTTQDIEFEPNKRQLLIDILDTYVESVLIGFFRESKVSEFTSRRIAMENASKNGDDMLRELSITFNRVRQAKITQEISEIVGGAEALK